MPPTKTTLVTLLLLVTGSHEAERHSDPDLQALEHEQTRAWARQAPAETAANRAALRAYADEHPDAARAHYLLGLAELQAVTLTNAAPDRRHLEETLAGLDRAQAHLERAYELDPDEADACATIALCLLQRFMLGRAAPEQGSLMVEWGQKAMAADPARVSVRLLSVWLEGSRGMLPPDQIDAWMGRFIELGEAILDRLASEEQAPEFWDLFGLGLVGRALVFSPRPRPREAAQLTEATLEVVPDFHMARAFLLPFVTPHEPLAPEAWSALEWDELGVELDADGSVPGLPDAVAVATARKGPDLWVRILLAAPPDEALFGINLVVDADDTQATGAPWWGGNTAFTFDRLVSVWVARDDEGTYRGAVGITDAAGALPGEMTNLGDGTVGFAVDAEGPAFVLRVPWDALGGSEAVRCVAAVGSNSQWNDDLPDDGSFVLER